VPDILSYAAMHNAYNLYRPYSGTCPLSKADASSFFSSSIDAIIVTYSAQVTIIPKCSCLPVLAHHCQHCIGKLETRRQWSHGQETPEQEILATTIVRVRHYKPFKTIRGFVSFHIRHLQTLDEHTKLKNV
jgi:hypothetical protein